jgi:hypothetical protein
LSPKSTLKIVCLLLCTICRSTTVCHLRSFVLYILSLDISLRFCQHFTKNSHYSHNPSGQALRVASGHRPDISASEREQNFSHNKTLPHYFFNTYGPSSHKHKHITLLSTTMHPLHEYFFSSLNGIILFSIIILLRYCLITMLHHYFITILHHQHHLLNLHTVQLNKQMLTYICSNNP